MSKDKVVDKSGAKAQEKARSNYEGQEHESLRLGHEADTKEAVVDAKENKSVHQKAKNDRFAVNGECSAAPDHDDAVRERAVTASKGSKSK